MMMKTTMMMTVTTMTVIMSMTDMSAVMRQWVSTSVCARN